MKESQEIALGIGEGRSRRERRLKPLGAGHIGDVAVAIGWSEDTHDFAAVRLDQVEALRCTGTSFDDHDGNLAARCLDRFDRQPRN